MLQAFLAVEEAAALQRVYVNGQEVLALVLSRLLLELSNFGIIPVDQYQLGDHVGQHHGEPSALLKMSAKKVTEDILSNGATTAVASWKLLRYLTTVVVAFATSHGKATLHDKNAGDFYKDEISGGLCGVFLPEDGAGCYQIQDLLAIHYHSSHHAVSAMTGEEILPIDISKDFLQRISLHLAEQLLSLLDIFIFPDSQSLDLSSATAQLHGLALVRGTETRTGNSHGPLLASLMRASLLLLQSLDPSSLRMLQCCSRLRCFVYYSLELIRESKAMSEYTSSFNALTLTFDRLLVAVTIESHCTLRKCAIVLREIESTPAETLFSSNESRKKRYRRLFRVSVELREILMTIHERRNSVLKDSLSLEAYGAFQSSMESRIVPSDQVETKNLSQKELMVRGLLVSTWINKFHGRLRSEGTSNVHKGVAAMLKDDSLAQGLSSDAKEIEDAFQKSLNSAFEGKFILHAELFQSLSQTGINVLISLSLFRCIRILGNPEEMGRNRCSTRFGIRG